MFNGTIRRIIGLDPAGPLYDHSNTGLNKSCAQFVQILHTEPFGFGTSIRRGDADFFANRGSTSQPGCSYIGCSHDKAVYFYFASLFPKHKFYSANCDQYGADQLSESLFGHFNDGKNGVFCFNTNPCFSYATNKHVVKRPFYSYWI